MLTPLELAVLDMMVDKPGETYQTIREQLSHVIARNRKFTGVGFFTNFYLPEGAPVNRNLNDMTLGGVGAELPNLKHGVGFLLFIREGVIQMLEGFTYDERWPENIEHFKLFKTPDGESR